MSSHLLISVNKMQEKSVPLIHKMDGLWRQDYKVVIVGGGIGGLATAIGMKLEGIQVEVLEASPILQEVSPSTYLESRSLLTSSIR